MLKLKPEWCDKHGHLNRDDDWMYQMTDSAGHIRADDMRIDTTGCEELVNVDDAYKNFYNEIFPKVYRVQDLDWFTPVSDEPRAILLFATPPEKPSNNVIFRMDAHGNICAHAWRIAVTDAMMAFARRVLPALPELIQKKWDERERLTAEGKSWPETEPKKKTRKKKPARHKA